jgi:hypothetical protein
LLVVSGGIKRDRNTVAICNSDHAVLRLAVSWIRRLSDNTPNFSIHYHEDQDLGELCAFWSGQLGINAEALGYQRKSNSGRLKGRQWRSRHGVLSVRVQGTLLRARLEAWIDRVRADWLDSIPLGA